IHHAVKKRIERGALTLTVRDEEGTSAAPEIRVNLELARRYHHALAQLERELGLERGVPLELLVAQRDVLVVGERTCAGDELFELLRRGLEAALDALLAMRGREGDAMAKDLRQHARGLARLSERIAELSQGAPMAYRQRLDERLGRLLGADV